MKDHPRMCGKDLMTSEILSGISGSPPHVRERPISASNDKGQHGITPACAGKTLADNDKEIALQDHPRMCGKDFRRQKSCLYGRGSPPHVRERLR